MPVFAMLNLRGIKISGLALSLLLHTITGVSLAFFHFRQQAADLTTALETLFDSERLTDEFTRDLNSDVEVAETLNITPGGGSLEGSVTGSVGGGGGGGGGTGGFGVATGKIDGSGQFRDPSVNINVGDPGLPGLGELGIDLGEGQIKGEPAAMAEGYGAALGRITQEMLRMLREEKLLVVWLFDESESMKDDQKEIREQFHKVYEELGIAMERDPKAKRDADVLLTSVYSFGESVTAITPKPTADVQEIRSAIDKIKIDESGKENLFSALNVVLDKFRSFRTKRKARDHRRLRRIGG